MCIKLVIIITLLHYDRYSISKPYIALYSDVLCPPIFGLHSSLNHILFIAPYVTIMFVRVCCSCLHHTFAQRVAKESKSDIVCSRLRSKFGLQDDSIFSCIPMIWPCFIVIYKFFHVGRLSSNKIFKISLYIILNKTHISLI